MAQEFGAKLTLKDNFSDVIQKAINATEALRRKLQATEKSLSKIGDKKIRIGAKLDSSVNSSLNKLADKIPKDKTIRIKARDEVTRSITNMQRDLYKMGRDLSLGMKDPFKGLNASSINAARNIAALKSTISALATHQAMRGSISARAAGGLLPAIAEGMITGRAVRAMNASNKVAPFIAGSMLGRRFSASPSSAGSNWRSSGYTGDPDYHEANARYHRLGRGDEPPHFDRQSRTIRYADADYADMIERQQRVMRERFGRSNYLSSHTVRDVHAGDGDYARVVDRRLGRAAFAYHAGREMAGERWGRVSSSLSNGANVVSLRVNAVTSAAESSIRSFARRVSNSRLGEVAMRVRFAGERALYGLRGPASSASNSTGSASRAASAASSAMQFSLQRFAAPAEATGMVDRIRNAVSSVQSSLSSIAGRVFSFRVRANTSEATAALSQLRSTIMTMGTVGGALAVAGVVKAIKGAADLESNAMSIEHFVKYANTKNVSEGKEAPKSDEEIKAESGAYISKLRKYAVDTPFGDTEVISAGRRAVNVMGGDLKDAEELVKIAGDMAALNPGKTIMDAMEALADMKTGEMERMKEFGLKISAEQFKGLVGKGKNDDLTEEEQTKAYRILMDHKMKTMFGGGAQKLSTTASGKFSTVTGTLESGLADIGTKFLPGIKTGLDKIIGALETSGPKIIAAFQPLADAFNAFVDSPLFTGDNALKVAGIAAAVLAISALCAVVIAVVTPIITVVGWITRLAALAGPLSRGIALVRTAMLGLNLAFLANPVTWVILGIVALIAAGVALYVYWDEVKQFFMDMWVGPSQVIDQFIAFLKEAFGVGFNFLLNNAKIILQFFSDLWNNPETAFDNYLNNVKSNFGKVADWLTEKWQAVCDFFSNNTPSANIDVSWNPGAGLDTSGGDGGSERAVGMEYIPYNGFQVSAHRGEAILTRTEADQWRAGNSGGGGVVINIHDPVVREESDLDRLGTLLANKICEVRSNMGAVPA